MEKHVEGLRDACGRHRIALDDGFVCLGPSDDVNGRSKTYEAIVKGDPMPTPGIPESLNVLLHELRGLGLKVTLD